MYFFKLQQEEQLQQEIMLHDVTVKALIFYEKDTIG